MDKKKLYFTVFTVEGKVYQLKREPSHEKIKKILDCECADDTLIGIYYNGKDHHDAVMIVDDLGIPKKKHINFNLNIALNRSQYWKNLEWKITQDRIVIVGDAIIVTEEPIL